jgi:hypothetical protein
MGTVAINPPKTPVTKGSSDIAAATLPNVCKMPGPPAPFVPTPLPNIGKSGDSPQGYSNTHGPTKFIGPGSMNVQIEGKNVQLLSDPMLNNCGPSGSPANAATMTGIVQMAKVVAVTYGDDKPCGKCGKTHPLDAGSESLEMIRRLFKRMRKSFDAQKAKIRDMNRAGVALKSKRKERLELQALQRTTGLTTAQQQTLAALPSQISVLEANVRAFEPYFNTSALLRWDEDYGTYSKGYMFGVMVCVCKNEKLAACSGKAPPELVSVVSEAGFACASPPVPVKSTNSANQNKSTNSANQNKGTIDPKAGWECAAKQIMEKSKHKPKQLIERWFSPMVKGLKHLRGLPVTRRSPTITFEALVEHPQTKTLTLEKAHTKGDFKTGENVPSCSKCQQWLAEMYCNNTCP